MSAVLSRVLDSYLEHADKKRTRLDRSVSLGRSSSNDIVVDDAQVSRQHALLNPQAGQLWLVDLGSMNGTYVNGRRVTRPTVLADGDQLGLGGKHFIVRFAARPAPASGDATETVTQQAIRSEQAWLVLADVVGFTKLVQSQAPEEVARSIGGWMLHCSGIFQKHRTEIQIFTGDGFLAYLPDRTDDRARFFAILAELMAYQNAPGALPFRLLMHRSQVTFGAVAPDGAESVLGPGVNLLFRFEKIASQLKATRALTREAIDNWPEKISPASLGKHALAGFAGVHELFKL